jgi:hypothetical protein
MQQLMEVVPLPKDYRRGLSLYHLMFESLDTLSASKGQKLAKKYLKSDRMDLELWNGYAQTEKGFGRISEVILNACIMLLSGSIHFATCC